MVTIEQAKTARLFHYGHCVKITGKRGGVKIMIEQWRRSGQTQLWKTRPAEFSVPIKFGMYDSSHLTHANAGDFHTADDCPIAS